ncbi:class I SAM-dependent methyltransferase [Candidatus Parcubacteria bacterium]|nr:MAG: class I SAM-dependent methyltransferase [Candidatus Parcubacteria bacterium]
MKWAKFWEEKIQEIAENSKVVLDVGGGKRFQKGMKEYEKLFKDIDYKTLDNVQDYSPDILGDIKNIPLPDESFDAVICRAVLEHIDDPFKAVSEIRRILKPGGRCLVSLPFLYPYHAEKGYYGDYYRFTGDGVKYLFKDFSKIEICKVRGFFETMTNLFPVNLYRKIFSPCARLLDKIWPSKNQTSGFNVFLTK